MRKYSAGEAGNVTHNRNGMAVVSAGGRRPASLNRSIREYPRRSVSLASAIGGTIAAFVARFHCANFLRFKRELAQPSKSAQCDLLISRSHCNRRRYKLCVVGGAARD
jgi:hypothetical protein